MLELGIQNNIAKPLQKRTSSGKNISDVYAGDHHIWPIKQDVVYFYNFDSVQLRFVWTDDNGKDFDTGTNITNVPGITAYLVGFGHGRSEGRTQPYLYWGGDNLQSGAECVMLDVGAIKRDVSESNLPATTKIMLRGNWYNTKGDGNLQVECTAFKGGVIVKAYQLLGAAVNVSNQHYAFADQNGKLPNGYEVYEAYKDENGEYHRINQVDDSVEIPGVPQAEVRRVFNINSVDYTSQGGKVMAELTNECKVWNQQINYKGDIYEQTSAKVYNRINNQELGDLKVILVNEDGSNPQELTRIYYSQMNTTTTEYTFSYGYVAGNSEFRGQQILSCYVNSTGHGLAHEEFAVVNYINQSEAGQIVSLNPINEE